MTGNTLSPIGGGGFHLNSYVHLTPPGEFSTSTRQSIKSYQHVTINMEERLGESTGDESKHNSSVALNRYGYSIASCIKKRSTSAIYLEERSIRKMEGPALE
ncbi:hypothetical protein MJO28_012066 [Puccinia striiformis f. sp. tritici]|uniref:Uncharacterized protein n=1 Tax=Puccinia striiformis f. sp. tritici TaxID=168172 RepID=A0ACC0DYV7_9BASI|nr:hypothetical protein MJO28_012066 [Puccinia striiformis f. sp. tritici]